MKNKKTKAAKKDPKASRPKSGKGFAKLSTTTKAVGLLAIATLGLGYLANRRRTQAATSAGQSEAAE